MPPREGSMTGHIGRREFITLLGGAAASWPLAARAQQPKMLRVGFVGMQPREFPIYTSFLKRMAELGYQEGRNLHSTTSKHRTSKATKETIASSRRARLTCSWRSGTSGRYVPRSWPRRAGQSRFWPSISTLWQGDMWRVSRVPGAM